jgi:transaldolase/glucose-6-phosphate isomerase
LWASTGTKNKDYSDVLYVEELIGPNTVNTVPPATLDAFRDHGRCATASRKISRMRARARRAREIGISLDAITAELVRTASSCLRTLPTSFTARSPTSATSLGGSIDRQQLKLGGDLDKTIDKSTEEWRASAKIRRSGRRTNRSGPATMRTNGWAG